LAKKKNSMLGKNLPMVSVCTPTHNWRIFIPALIQCFESQNYPAELMEWVVVDDGNDPVEDLFSKVESVNYIHCEENDTGFCARL
jgi:glycosyltransferase involved in cell wall biosynthesis